MEIAYLLMIWCQKHLVAWLNIVMDWGSKCPEANPPVSCNIYVEYQELIDLLLFR